ncbi:MAG: hypothetical protein ACLTZT_18105 [Butyricimonas faecalis]
MVSKLVMYILRLHKLDKLNVKVNDDDPKFFLDSLIVLGGDDRGE